MSQKEALRDLQARLAERMEQARTEQRPMSWLALEAEGTGFLVPLGESGEIFPLTEIVPLPHTRPWFCGVANLRGGLHGVVDLAAFLGLRARGAAESPREGARLVALNPSLGVNCALLVDRLSGLRHDADLKADQAVGSTRPGFAGTNWRDASGRGWQEIRLAALAADGQFLAIAS